MLCLYFVCGFYGYTMCAWIYGFFFGCYLYSSKILCYSIVKTKEFSRTWSIVQASQSLPSMMGIIITGIYILGILQNSLKTSNLFWFAYKKQYKLFLFQGTSTKTVTRLGIGFLWSLSSLVVVFFSC
jgi:hypothetical protein